MEASSGQTNGKGAACALAISILFGCGTNTVTERALWVQRSLEALRDSIDGGTIALDQLIGGVECSSVFRSQHQPLIDSMCAVLVPGSTRLWFEVDDAPCWCLCNDLAGLGRPTLDSLIAQKRIDHVARFKDRSKSWMPLDGFPPLGVKRAQPISLPDTSGRRSVVRAVHRRTTAQTDPGCDRGDHEVPFGEGCIMVEDLVELYRSWYSYIDVTYYPSDRPWTSVVVSIHDGSMTINIPPDLMEHDEVGGELIAFLLAHEIGHANGEISECGSNSEVVCEGDADHWGAAYGMREVFEGSDYIRVSKGAQAQLEAYYESLGADDQRCGNPFCSCEDPSCGHPPAVCRAQTIKMGRWASQRRPVCNDRWHTNRSGDCEPCRASAAD